MFHKYSNRFSNLSSTMLFPIGLSVGMVSVLTSCITTEDVVLVPKVYLKNISFSADQDANENRVVTVHLVVPKKPELYNEILKMDALAYFSITKQLQADYPNDLEVFTWEIVPGSSLQKQRILLKDFRGQGAIVFLQYGDEIPGIHRLVLPQKSSCKVLLKRNEAILAY